jgi:hypothetical protein
MKLLLSLFLCLGLTGCFQAYYFEDAGYEWEANPPSCRSYQSPTVVSAGVITAGAQVPVSTQTREPELLPAR